MEGKRPAKKGGAEREREKRAAELQKAGKDPKQPKISFFATASTQSAIPTISEDNLSPLGESLPSESETESSSNMCRLATEDVHVEHVEQAIRKSAIPTTSQNNLSPLGEILPSESEKESSNDMCRFAAEDMLVEDDERSTSSTAFYEQDITVSKLPKESGNQEVSKFSLPCNSTACQKLDFLKQHPIQPKPLVDADYVPYIPKKLYYRILPNGSQVHRSWLTVSVENREVKSLHCSICIAFSRSPSNFTTGCSDLRRPYQNVERHENSQIHRESVEAFIAHKKNVSLDTLINKDLQNLRASQIKRNIDVLYRVFQILKHLGKQGLPFRGHGTNESLYNFNDSSLNHGNFLETVKLVSLFDAVLSSHLEKSIESSSSRKQALSREGSASCGRGNLVTFLSKSTVNKVVEALLVQPRKQIIQRIGDKKISIQLDSTQDVSAKSQGMLIVRLVVNEQREERLLGVLEMKDSTGAGMHALLQNFVSQHGLKMGNIVGMSFDGALNMRGEFRGLQAHIIKEVPKAVYVWCYCHILNLCIIDSCKPVDATNFFGLLNKVANFIGDSCKRADVWRDLRSAYFGHGKLKKLQTLGQTRWWAREKAVQRMFSEPGSLFLDTLVALTEIGYSGNFDSDVASSAVSLLVSFNTFTNILVAHVFLEIFSIFGPVSKYLQTKGLDILTAYLMIESAKDSLLALEFEKIYEAATKFAFAMNERSENSPEIECEIVVPTELRGGYVSKKKRMPGENAVDERSQDPVQRFRVEVFRPVIDQLVTNLDDRFAKNADLIKDMQFLDPRKFSEIAANPSMIPPGSLQKISEKVSVNSDELKKELLSFASVYPSLVSLLDDESQLKSPRHSFDAECHERSEKGQQCENDCLSECCLCDVDELEEPEGHAQQIPSSRGKDVDLKCTGSCAFCISCVHKVLFKYNLCAAAYTNLFTVYEYLLTLSFTQVSCERACSKLKLVKTRLRANLIQTRLEALMLMSVERDLLEEIRFDEVLDLVRQSSSLMNHLLSV